MDDTNPIFDADLLNTILLQGSNDYLLNIGNSDYFDKSSMDAEGNGFEIIEQINELGVFRIKIKNPLLLNFLMRMKMILNYKIMQS